MINFNYDIEKHNDEFRIFSEACKRGTPPRIMMTISSNPRMILMDEKLNSKGIMFEQYFNNPEIMLEVHCCFQEYALNNLVWDKYMGVTKDTRFHIYPDFQNVFEPSWFGCPIAYNSKYEPSTRHLLTEDNKYTLFEKGLIEPFSGQIQKAREYTEFFAAKEKEGYTWNGTPIAASNGYGLGTDGPMTIACSLRGATEFCIDLYEDTEYALELLDYITENVINRIKTLRKYFGHSELSDSIGLADDSIAMLSTSDYVKYIMPFHKKIISSLSTEKNPNFVHLCGDATRHFITMRDNLCVNGFDTGFPVNHGKLVREVGEKVMIHGGVHVQTLLCGNADDVRFETKRILGEVLPCRNFTLKEANNLSPGTPPENLVAMYETVKEYGKFEQN